MSRIADSIYYTRLSDGCSSDQAAQSAVPFNDSLCSARFDSYPLIVSREGHKTAGNRSWDTVKGNPGHSDCFAMRSFR